ncbi:MAG: D-glycero-alpha-D-manno-heptose-7-phosphate kinase [Thermoleophilaceae bacterium]|jgi:D-glycero-alpha-D-manno-heptose-7-phosphate kinase|nr:D-glycero-alpha-D-manno-heptose-7-phosphate kinase [Thermoleophilaceae bacterium]
MLIRAKAPLRISFAGGGTDVPPFPEREGGLVLNATINRYAYGTLSPRDDDKIGIESVDFGTSTEFSATEGPAFDGKLDLAKAAVATVGESEDHRGFDLFLHSNAPPGSGLGSSSAMMVALIGVLAEFRNMPLTDYEVAEMAFRIERVELGIKGGLQDQYAAAFGGFNFIELYGDRVVVNPLRIRPDIMLELEHNMLLAFTGTTRTADHIIDDQTARFEQAEEHALSGLREQKVLAVEMKDALLKRRLTDFGHLLDDAWQAKKRMSDRISNPHIDEMYEAARREGALGGKVTGAGGGGFMLFYCDYRSKHRVAETLSKMGARVDEFAFEHEGMRTWRAPREA